MTGSDNGLSPDRRKAITSPNAGLLLIGTMGIEMKFELKLNKIDQ